MGVIGGMQSRPSGLSAMASLSATATYACLPCGSIQVKSDPRDLLRFRRPSASLSRSSAQNLSTLRHGVRRTDIILQNRFTRQYQIKYVQSTKCAVNSALDNQVESGEESDEEVCELVNGVELVLGGGDDSFNAYLLKAVKNNNGAAVLLLSDVFGFEDSGTRDFAYRLSCNGYNVLVPDLFRGEPWHKERLQSEFEEWRRKHLPERVASDIETSSKWLVDEFAAAGISDKLGIVGFCFGGGRLVETLARDAQSHFGAAVCFYGTRIDPSLAAHLKIPVLFILGENDPLCPIELFHKMESQIKGSQVCVYAGRGHGFAHHPESPEDDEDAEHAFTAVRNWLHKHLLQNINVSD
uniref:Carboxymethylenebutenolidase homolog n=1 Tax=Araucaria cunninghamii TaxID=56994 RepID=A0A0D6R3Z6_ARACU